MLRRCDRVSLIYQISKDKEVSQDAGKIAVRLKSDTTWLHYAKQGFAIHHVPDIRARMADSFSMPTVNDPSRVASMQMKRPR